MHRIYKQENDYALSCKKETHSIIRYFQLQWKNVNIFVTTQKRIQSLSALSSFFIFDIVTPINSQQQQELTHLSQALLKSGTYRF